MLRSFISVILLWLCASLGAQTIIYVNHEHDPAGDGSSWESPFSQIQPALDAAEDGDEIWITSGTYRTGIDPSVSFNVDNSVSIYGGFAGDESSKDSRSEENEATILDGYLQVSPTLSYHLMKVAEDVQLKLDNITFKNSDASNENEPFGGAIYSQADSMAISNCRFINNNANERGGAIYCMNNRFLSIDHSYFDDNNATTTAAIAFMKSGRRLSIENTHFTGSSNAQNLIYADSSWVDIAQCSFNNHTDIGQGLISSISRNSFHTSVDSCEFTENESCRMMNIVGHAFLSDIAIYNNNNNTHACYFIGEEFANVIIDNFLYEDNLNDSYTYSALYFSQVNHANLTNVTFNNLSGLTSSSISFRGNILILDNADFSNLSGESRLCVQGRGNFFKMSNSSVENITTPGASGFGDLTIDRIFIEHSTFNKCDNGGRAGLFNTDGDFFKINNCSFNEINAYMGGVFYSTSDKLEIDSSSFTNNHADLSYGCFYSYGSDSAFVRNTTFQNNHANLNASVFQVENPCHVHQCDFSGNTCDSDFSHTVRGHNMLVTASTFEENKATHGILYTSDAKIMNCLFKNNYSDTTSNTSPGGTLYSRGQLTCIGNVFDNNFSYDGGAIYNDNEAPSYFINNTIINNKTFNNRSGAFWFGEDVNTHFLNNLIWENGDSAIYFEAGQGNLTDLGGNISDQEEWFSGDFIVEFIDDYTPATSSSMVDAGMELNDSLQYTTDLFDNPRVKGEGIDIGAVESPYSIPTSITSIPTESSQAPYPNPVSEVLYLDQSYENVTVYTMEGNVLEEYHTIESISTNKWQPGNYLVKCKSSDSSHTYKIMKQ